MKIVESHSSRRFVGRLQHGDHLPDALIDLCESHHIEAAEVRALGAVMDLQVTEYDVDRREYRTPIERKGASEILMVYGNVSRREGRLFAHLHISASFFENGRPALIAGHLVRAKVFACEFVIVALDDVSLDRQPDEPTGLWLWDDVRKK